MASGPPRGTEPGRTPLSLTIGALSTLRLGVAQGDRTYLTQRPGKRSLDKSGGNSVKTEGRSPVAIQKAA